MFYFEFYRLLIRPLLSNNQKFSKYIIHLSNVRRSTQEYNTSEKAKEEKECCKCRCQDIFISKGVLGICLVLHALFYTVYYVAYQLFIEGLCYGVIFKQSVNQHIEDIGLPRSIVMVISCIAWLIITYWHGKDSIINNKSVRKSLDFQWGNENDNDL